MTKKPEFALVGPTPATPASPPTPRQNRRVLWESIMAEYQITGAGSRETLLQICSAADRAAEYAAIIDSEGPMIGIKHGPPREHRW